MFIRTKIALPYILYGIMFLNYSNIYGQLIDTSYYQIEYYTPETNSYGTWVASILQSNDGFLWLGSSSGLYKYDGYNFEQKIQGSKAVDEMWELRTNRLFEDAAGNIWGYSHGSIFKYNNESGALWISDFDLPDILTASSMPFVLDNWGAIWSGSADVPGPQKFIISFSENADTLITTEFKEKIVPYPKELFEILESSRSDTIATLLKVGNNENRNRDFELFDSMEVIIVCMGEYGLMPNSGDAGWLKNANNQKLLTFDMKEGNYAGGDICNRMKLSLLTLGPGNYKLQYKSDYFHSYDNWKGVPPENPEGWGIQIYKANKTLKSKIKEWNNIPPIPDLYQKPLYVFVKGDHNILWAGSQNSLLKITTGNFEQGEEDVFERIVLWPDTSNWKLNVQGIIKNPDGTLLLLNTLQDVKGTLELSLDLFDPVKQSFTNINKLDGSIFEVNPYTPIPIEYDIQTEDIWLGTTNNGLCKWEKPYDKNPQLIRSRNGQSIPNTIVEITLDYSGVLWFSTPGVFRDGGLFKLDTSSDVLKFHSLSPPGPQKVERPVHVGFFSEDSNGKVWINTLSHGLYGFNPENEEIEHVYQPDTFTSKVTGLPLSNSNIFSDSKGNLWVGARNGGLFQFHPDKKSFTRYDVPNDIYQFGEWGRFFVELEDEDGFLWGSIQSKNHDKLIIKFDSVSKQFLMDTCIPDVGGLAKFIIDKDNVMWIASGQALKFFKIDLSTPNKRDRVLYNMVWDFEIDSSGMVWAATMNEGLALIDPQKGLIERITEKDGLLSNNVNRIVIDNGGRLWLMTNRGLTIYNPSTESFSRPQDIKYLEGFSNTFGRPFIHSSGYFYVRTTRKGGFYTFHPDSIRLNPIPPKMAITDFQLINSRLSSDNEAYQSNDITQLEELNLSHSQNSLSIEYRGLHYDNPEENEYSIWMDGLNEDWVNVGKEKVVRYSKLAPGNYTFHVKASNADGIWSEPASLSFTINPPWYWAWYTKFIYALILISGLYYWIQGLRKKVKVKEAQLLKEQENSEALELLNVELNEINTANQRFVPQDFMKILGKKSIRDLKLGDQRKTDMTILFSDIRAYTALSETMSPDDNFKFINGYLGRVGPIIKQHGGFISQYYGDGLMALFLDDHLAAIRASVEIQKVLNDYNKERITKKRQPVKTGIGLNTGPLMLGIIGDQERYDSTVIADAVNTASRMEGLTKIFGASIILSERTLQELLNSKSNADYAYRYLGKVKVKGRDKAVNIYDLYEGDPVSERQLKAKSQSDFESGLKQYGKRQFGKAAEAFKKVLDVNEADKAAQYYLDKSVDYIVNDVPEGWAGVEEMVMK